MDVADKEHRENINKMEYKFFKEKVMSSYRLKMRGQFGRL